MEATGGLWFLVAHHAYAKGVPVYVLNPQRVHALGEVEGRVTKTDALDAEQIAVCAQVLRQTGLLHRWDSVAEGLAILRRLVRLRTHYQEQLTVQRAQRRALQEQGAAGAVLAIAEQAVVALVKAQGAEWERTHPAWQPVLRRWRTASGVGRWGTQSVLVVRRRPRRRLTRYAPQGRRRGFSRSEGAIPHLRDLPPRCEPNAD